MSSATLRRRRRVRIDRRSARATRIHRARAAGVERRRPNRFARARRRASRSARRATSTTARRTRRPSVVGVCGRGGGGEPARGAPRARSNDRSSVRSNRFERFANPIDRSIARSRTIDRSSNDRSTAFVFFRTPGRLRASRRIAKSRRIARRQTAPVRRRWRRRPRGRRREDEGIGIVTPGAVNDGIGARQTREEWVGDDDDDERRERERRGR